MTLAFGGGGLLDESEVQQGVTVNINSASQPISQIAQTPIPVPNATKPKDITPPPTVEQLEAQKILAKMDPTKLAEAAGETFTPEAGLTAMAPLAVAEQVFAEPVTKKRRKRQEVNLEFSLDGPEPAGEPVIEIPKVPEKVLEFIQQEQKAVEAVTGQNETIIPPTKPAPLPGAPTSEQLKEYRQRLTKYTDDILPKAGMVPSVGLGGPTVKTRLYAMQRFKVTDIRLMTVDNWTEFFQFLDNSSPEIVIDTIDKAVQ